MTSPSADRPLPLPKIKSFTEDDVEMLVKVAGARLLAMTGLTEIPASRALFLRHEIRDVLGALAAAGRLLPPDAEHREEWGVQIESFPAGTPVIAYHGLPEGRARKMADRSGGVPVRRRPAGPWEEVDGSTDA